MVEGWWKRLLRPVLRIRIKRRSTTGFISLSNDSDPDPTKPLKTDNFLIKKNFLFSEKQKISFLYHKSMVNLHFLK